MRLRALINGMQQRLGVAREDAAEASPEGPAAAVSGTPGHYAPQHLSRLRMGALQTSSAASRRALICWVGAANPAESKAAFLASLGSRLPCCM